ncbi:dTDP-4-dehydrorhamnose reductase [Paenibacillus sp. SYP-B4298]|uniref:dTDP-4-dehydrorhamnose reductase n=1 Tax=Paenibacillus sp. SYP-B4298 TaxID=2996034 RepID=UPI0022DE2A24|nr:dTDP-4-dehydrorhamnose reductase [Paenibacillus sp. SYP-B4298]
MKKRVLLLGRGGQLGTDVQRVLQTAKVEVISLSRDVLDLHHTFDISARLSEYIPFDVLINCTAVHSLELCEDDPGSAFSVNAIAVHELARFCNARGIVLFHISTDYVMDGTQRTPYTEEEATSPLNMYGVSKVAGEQLLAANHDRYFIFRVSSLFGVAGPSRKQGNFVDRIIQMISRPDTPAPSVVCDQQMSPTHTLDVARAIVYFIQESIDAYGVYHCSGEGACSWYTFACEIARAAGITAEFLPISLEDVDGSGVRRPKYSVLDNAKMNRLYRMPEWEQSLGDYMRLKGYTVR